MTDKVSADNWDLSAVVRSCSSATETATSSTNRHPQKFRTREIDDVGRSIASDNPLSLLSSMKFEEEEDPFSFPNLVQEPNNGFEELQDSFRQFFSHNPQQKHHQQEDLPPATPPAAGTPTTPSSSSVFVFGHADQNQSHQQFVQQLALGHDCLHVQAPLPPPPPRSLRKRKTPQRRTVCHVTAENLSADLWAWRKYGQKPIKGSPYPRNYYRCSSSKGCSARKQVERGDTDPNIFIVSYSGDHTHPRPTHRNSLAGSSRNKFPIARNPVPDTATSSPPSSATIPTTPILTAAPPPDPAEDDKVYTSAGDKDDEEEDLLIPNPSAAMNEDPFSGLDELEPNCSAFPGGGGSC